MKVNWLVESGPFVEDINPLLKEIKSQRHNLTIVKYHPFQSKSYNDLFKERDCVIFYGSINLAIQLQRETPWIPGPIVTFSNYDCTNYYPYFGEHLFNSNYRMLPYGEVNRQWEFINKDNRCFIRPNSGRKLFGGHVIDNKSLTYRDGPVGPGVRPEDLVVVSSPKKIKREWRFVIANNEEVIAGCQYKNKDRLALANKIPAYVKDYVQKIIPKNWKNADPLYTIDIAEHDNEKLGVLEINSFSCSGLYCCDPKPIVEVVSKIAQKEWENIWSLDK